MKKVFAVFTAFLLISLCLDGYAHARAGRAGGGAMSYGSRGSRTYTPPARTYQPAQQQPSQGVQATAQPSTAGSYSSRSWLLRSIAGGFIGAIIGNLLFSTLGYAGLSGAASGVSAFDIVLICLVIFLIYRFMARRREEAASYYRGCREAGGYGGAGEGTFRSAPTASNFPSEASAPGYGSGSAERFEDIRRFDPGFDEAGLRENAQDIFFKVQSCWMKRDFDAMSPLLAPELSALMRADIERMRSEGRINRLEEIRLNELAVTEAWVEEGGVFATVRLDAGMIDYTTDDSGGVVEGSRTEPAAFTEYWTFSKPVGKSRWRLSAIQQG